MLSQSRIDPGLNPRRARSRYVVFLLESSKIMVDGVLFLPYGLRTVVV